MNSHQQPGSKMETPHVRIEDDLKKEKQRKFKQALREEFGEGKIDTHSKKFTEVVVKQALGAQKFNNLPEAEKERWLKRINRIIIDKLGGHAEAGWKRELIEEKKKKKAEEQSPVARENRDNEDEETVQEFLSSIENYSFTSD